MDKNLFIMRVLIALVLVLEYTQCETAKKSQNKMNIATATVKIMITKNNTAKSPGVAAIAANRTKISTSTIKPQAIAANRANISTITNKSMVSTKPIDVTLTSPTTIEKTFSMPATCIKSTECVQEICNINRAILIMTSGYKWTKQMFTQGVLAGTDPPYDIYVCRARHKNNLLVGKLAGSLNLCYIAVDGQEVFVKNYEILNETNVTWISMPSNSPSFPPRAILGGLINENDDVFYKLYIGRTKFNGGTVTGYIHPRTKLVYFGHGGAAYDSASYDILVKRP